jgi:histidinol dehydrogenase
MPKQNRMRIWKVSELSDNWFKRQKPDNKANDQIENEVKGIINRVEKNGDSALFEFTAKYDKAHLDSKNLRVTAEDIEEAYKSVSKEQVSALKFIKEKVDAFERLAIERAEFTTSKEGTIIQIALRPIESVGCYVPGGQAAYPSTLVMTAVPAKVAGVPRIVVCSPPNSEGKVDSLVVVAADVCGVDEVYKVGGAQAIAALAYGTKTIQPVKKIVGPGSRFVTMAKMLVSRDVAIDMPAGPSEVLVVADEFANPRLIALDMISQAEHGTDSVAGLITTSWKLAEEVQGWLAKTAAGAERGKIVRKALEKYGFIITCEDINEAVELTNFFAPEHVEIMTQNPEKIAKKITSAGLILIGSYSPVALSDYGSGTNHVLPTGGFGHTFSGLSALEFVRRVSIVEGSKEGLESVRERVKVMTEAESLPNHYKAVEARFEK